MRSSSFAAAATRVDPLGNGIERIRQHHQSAGADLKDCAGSPDAVHGGTSVALPAKLDGQIGEDALLIQPHHEVSGRRESKRAGLTGRQTCRAGVGQSDGPGLDLGQPLLRERPDPGERAALFRAGTGGPGVESVLVPRAEAYSIAIEALHHGLGMYLDLFRVTPVCARIKRAALSCQMPSAAPV